MINMTKDAMFIYGNNNSMLEECNGKDNEVAIMQIIKD